MEAKTIYGIGVYDPKVPHTYQPSNLSKVKKIAERILLIESPKAICERLTSADE